MTATDPDALARLAAADARRDGPASDRVHVTAAYAELSASIDPSTTAGAARVEWLLESGVAPPPVFEPLLRRAATQRRKVHLRRIAAGALHSYDVARGDVRGAEERLIALLRELTADGAPEACAVAANLAQVFLAQGREFEVLVTARRAVRTAREHGVSGVLGIALSKVSWALMQLEDWDAANAVADEIEGIVPDLEEAHVPHALRLVHKVRASRALALGWIGIAREEIRAFRALDAVAEPAPGDRWIAAELAARAALASARPREAEAHASNLTSAKDGSPAMRLRGATIHIHALVAAGDFDGAIAAANALRPSLLEGIRNGTLVATALHATAEIAGLLDPNPASLAFVAIASEALFARIAQLEGCVGALDGLSDHPDEDRARLAMYRARFVEQHRGLLSTIARLHDVSGATPPPALSSFTDGRHVRVCAWCHTVRTDDGRDLPVGHLLPLVADLQITHGICDPCLARTTRGTRAG